MEAQHQQARLQQAAAERVLARDPNDLQALYQRAMALSIQGRADDAVAGFDRLLTLAENLAPAWIARGCALARGKRFDDALASFDRAEALAPAEPDLYHNRAATLGEMGRFEEAIRQYDAALARRPKFPLALENRGVAQWHLGRFAEALDSYDKVLVLEPRAANVWNNRGAVLRALGQAMESLRSCERAISLNPNFAFAYANRGLALKDLGRLEPALASFDRALALDPASAVCWNNRGTVLQAMRRLDDALASYTKAIALNPNDGEAFGNRGMLLWSEMRRYEEAVSDLEQARGVDFAPGELLHIRMQAGDWRDLDAQKARIDRGVREGRRVIRPFAYQGISDSPADLAACSRIFAALFPAMPGAKAAVPDHAKIRIGYVSADFREQATAYLTVGLYEAHDKSQFELVAFDNGFSDDSPIRQRLEAAFDKFVDISQLSDRAAADLIRAEGIDILVNLNGYFGAPRMGVFAHRPAPIQVNYLGFPATLGAPYIDYIVADRVVIPDNERSFYTEQVVTLPVSYQATDAKRVIAPERPSRADNGLPDQGVVFCNFNQSYKLGPAVFAAWMRVLKQVPGSVLWLLDGVPALRDNLRDTAQEQGVDGARLIFAPMVATDRHLARLALADLFLDTLPYNAHTTASDSLWSGVPLLTCRGTAFAGRVAASLLEAVGLPGLITETLTEYERLAIALGNDAARLATLKNKLAQNRTDCALFDTDRFRRNMEAAYTRMWEIAQRGEPPRCFSIGNDAPV